VRRGGRGLEEGGLADVLDRLERAWLDPESGKVFCLSTVLARCLGIDISSAVAWQRAASGDWHQYAGRIGTPTTTPSAARPARRLTP
jgi:hypothetical protein